MSKQNHEHGYALHLTRRSCAGRGRARFVGARLKQQLTYVTTLFTLIALFFAAVESARARPLLAVAPPLGTAMNFAVLASSTATNTGPTVVIGDLGVSPGTALTGFPPGVVTGGTIHTGDAVAAQAQRDVATAYNDLVGQACTVDLAGMDLGGLTLTPGIYCFPGTSAQVTGELTLDGQGDASAVFIFQIGSTLTTASNAAVVLINGAASDNVFWQVGSSATLGTDSAFIGNVLALASITLNTGVSLFGRAWAQNGAVTMDTNHIALPLTDIVLSATSVAENMALATTIGVLSSTRPDAEPPQTHTYTLVSGVGSTDNSSFNLADATLKTNAVFNYETKNVYSIRIRATDDTTLSIEKAFTILVTDVNDAPVAVADVVEPASQVITGVTELFVLANDTDEDSNDLLSVASVGLPNSGTAITTATSIIYTPAPDFNGVVTFPYTIRDNHSTGTLTDTSNVTVTVVANDARGDCNADGIIDAGDFSAVLLELYDTDVSSHWYESYQLGFAGSPLGCDANANQRVTIADLVCVILVAFGNAICTTSTSAPTAGTVADAELAVGEAFVRVDNNTVDVPVRLLTNGQRVAAASFVMGFDPAQLTLAGADASQNGLPGAVTFHTPQGMVTLANYNQAAGRLTVTVYALSRPLPTLSDGLVVTVTFTVNPHPTGAATAITLLQSSLGDDQGQDTPVQMSDGNVWFVQQHILFLPMMSRS